MKKLLLAAVLGLGVVGGADAALYCKDQDNKTIFWQAGDAKPVTDGVMGHFDVRKDVVCFVSSYANYQLLKQFSGIPYMEVVGGGLNADGLIYRGDLARFIIENLPAANGQATTKAQYDAAKP